jgi:hypothetical protein
MLRVCPVQDAFSQYSEALDALRPTIQKAAGGQKITRAERDRCISNFRSAGVVVLNACKDLELGDPGDFLAPSKTMLSEAVGEDALIHV